MGQYSAKGLYAGYDKNNKERDALDYYATPPWEVENILREIQIKDLSESLILDPGCGGGHLIDGILKVYPNARIIGTDVQPRDDKIKEAHKTVDYRSGLEFDFLSDSYPIEKCDYVIMNPPFKTIIPFVLHSLDIAEKGVLMLARIQFLEGVERYEKVLKSNPPTDIYVYIDRIACYKGGDFGEKPNSIQCYAWFYWDKGAEKTEPKIHFLRKFEKRES